MIQTPDLVDIATRLSNESDAYISGFLGVRKDTSTPTYQRLISILKKIIDRSYTDGVDRFLKVNVDDSGNISGYFVDGAKTIEFGLKNNNLSTKLARVRNDSLAIRLDRKKRNCQKGIPCKNGCISRDKTCLAKLGEIASPGELTQLRQAAVNLKLEQNAVNKPPETPPPPKQDYEINPDTGKPYTIRELKKVASNKGVVGYSNMNTEELKQSIKFVDETPPEQQQRLAKTIASDRSTGNRAIKASGVRGREKRSLQDSNRTWKNLQTLAKFAGTQPVGWGAAAIGAFLLGASIRQYERAKGEYRSHFKEAAEEAQERAANLGSSKNGLIQRTQKNNITFLISAGKGAGSDAIQKEFEKYKDSEDEGDRWLANNHHFIPFNLKESGAKPGGNDIENSVNGLTDYLTNFKRGKDQDAVDLAAQIYAYGIQRKQPESVSTGLRKIQNRYETLIKQEGRLQARVENLQNLVERQTNPIQKRVLESRLVIAQSAVVKAQNQKRNNRTAYAKLEKEGDKKLKPALANKGKNINILAHSRAGQTSKTALEYLARMHIPGEPTGKEILEQVNLVMLSTPHFGFTENVSKRQRTITSAQDPVSSLPVFGEGARQQWVSSVKGHGWEDYLADDRVRESIREVFGYYEDSLLERRRKEVKQRNRGDSYLGKYILRFDAKKPVCKTGKPCKSKSGKVVCIPKSHKCASEDAGDDGVLLQKKTPFYQNRNFQIGLASAGVSTLMVGGALIGASKLIEKDLQQSSVDFNSIRQPPNGGKPDEQTLAKYETFKAGDLIRKNIKSDRMGNRQHYAVYVGKDPKTGDHMIIDTGIDWKSRDNVPYVRTWGLTWGSPPDGNFKSDSEYEKVPPEEMHLVEGTKKLSPEEIVERSQKMLYQTFKYEGFESNCEAFARAMVEGKAYSSQGLKVSPLTNFTSRLVTDKLLEIRSKAQSDQARAFNVTNEKTILEIAPDLSSFKLFPKSTPERDEELIKKSWYLLAGKSDYARDKYKMTAKQMADYLDKEEIISQRRKWEEKANPYNGTFEKGYLTNLKEAKEEQDRKKNEVDLVNEQNKNLIAKNTVRPFNRFAITVRVDKVNKDSIADDIFNSLRIRHPEEFSKIVEMVSAPFGEMAKPMKIELYKNYLLMLYALLNQDKQESQVNIDSYWEGFNLVRLDKRVKCEKGKPCKTKSGKEICIPKSHKCSSESSPVITPSAKLSLPAPAVPGLAAISVFSAYMAARDVMNTVDTQKLERNPSTVLDQKQVDELKLEKPVGNQGNVSKAYFVQDNAQKRYVLKQSVPIFYNQAASEVVASEMGQKAGINVNKVRLIPNDTNHPLKGKGRAATLHEVVPGKALAEQDDVPKTSMVQMNGFHDGIIKSMTHPDLAKIAALDTFTDNWDRGRNNTFYDKETNSYHAIDMGASYNRIETAIPAIAKKTRNSLKDFDFNKLSEPEKQGMQTYLGTLKTLHDSNPPHETVNKYAHYLKLSGGDWDVFRRYVSAKEIYNNHRETGELINFLENKLNGKNPKRDSRAYLNGFNSIRADKIDCEKGKPCKTKSGKEVCIPKSHKCSSENKLTDKQKKVAIAGGAAIGGLVAGAAMTAALKKGSKLATEGGEIAKVIKESGIKITDHPMKVYLEARKQYRDNFVNSADRAEEMSKSVPTEKLPKNIKSVNFTVPGFTGWSGHGNDRKTVEKVEGYFAYKLKGLLGENHHVVGHQNREFTLEDIKEPTWESAMLSQYLKNILIKKHNPESVKLASEVMAWKGKNPDKEINLFGHSAGGMVTHEAAEILAVKKIPVKVINLGSPWYGLTQKVGESYTIAEERDFFFHGKQGNIARDEVKVFTKIPTKKNPHFLDHYLTSPEIGAKITELVEQSKAVNRGDSIMTNTYWDSCNQTISRFDGRGKRCGKGYIPADAECKQGQSQIPKGKVRLRTPVTPVAALAGAAAIGLAGGVGVAAAKSSNSQNAEQQAKESKIQEAGKRVANSLRKTGEVAQGLFSEEKTPKVIKKANEKVNNSVIESIKDDPELLNELIDSAKRDPNLVKGILEMQVGQGMGTFVKSSIKDPGSRKVLAKIAAKPKLHQSIKALAKETIDYIVRKDSRASDEYISGFVITKLESLIKYDAKGKRCGRGYIPANAKCKVGGSAGLRSPNENLNTALAATGAIAGVTALGLAGGALATSTSTNLKQAKLERQLAEESLRKAEEIKKQKEEEEKKAKEEEEKRKNRTLSQDLKSATANIAASALEAAVPGALAGAAVGPKGAIVGGLIAGGVAAGRTASQEFAQISRKRKPGVAGEVAGTLIENLPSAVEIATDKTKSRKQRATYLAGSAATIANQKAVTKLRNYAKQ